ncbi:MAG: hypothetical protein U9N82_13825, partial [Thermodesulfobacteriota bacterium]|nr:hypothetical protein [Thermodesulfobacteriota bacterium]
AVGNQCHGLIAENEDMSYLILPMTSDLLGTKGFSCMLSLRRPAIIIMEFEQIVAAATVLSALAGIDHNILES